MSLLKFSLKNAIKLPMNTKDIYVNHTHKGCFIFSDLHRLKNADVSVNR